MKQQIIYKIADHTDQQEMEQIYQLNYETFVEEIPQHGANKERRLVDRFHRDNTYVVAKQGAEVIGMIAVAEKRPFSLDGKLADLDRYLPAIERLCEIRLLSIKSAYRGGMTFYGLIERLVTYCVEKGYTMALISGTIRQLKLYKHLGFVPFGPLVGTEAASYQPMYLTVNHFKKASRLFRRLFEREAAGSQKKSSEKAHYFLPGPVAIPEKVQAAWKAPALSHRSDIVKQLMQDVRSKLCALTNARHAEIMVGTGTLANDAVAAQLRELGTYGLVLANGEFGERLIGHASKWGLSFQTMQKAWNTPFSLEEIAERLETHPEIRWLWVVHCETSTGYVQQLSSLKALCKQYNVHLCLDACSTVGAMPVDLSGVFLASTVSGKGLASYPGLAIVMHSDTIQPSDTIPGYLDLGVYQASGSIPYTHTTNGLQALHTAMEDCWYADQALYEKVLKALRSIGMDVLTGEDYAASIVTVCLPRSVSSRLFGDQLKQHGVHTSYESNYLLEKNWLQLALMGEQHEADVQAALEIIKATFKKCEVLV